MGKKKFLQMIIGCGLVLMLLLAAVGCEVPEEDPEADPEEVVEEEGEVELSFSTWHPPEGRECQSVWEPMLQELEEKSDGRISYTTYYGGALGAGEEHFDIVADGMSDFGYYTATWTPGRFPLSDVLSMPAAVRGKDVATEIGNAMYEKILHQDFEDEDVEVMHLNGCVSSFIWTTEKVETLEDLDGMRLRSPGGLQTYMIESLGAEPVFMPLGDVYMQMETGDIDGIVTCPQLIQAFSLYEVAEYAVVADFGCVTEGVVMNQNTWQELPEDLQSLVEEVTENPYQLTGGLSEAAIGETMDELPDMGPGVQFLELPEEEIERWHDRFTDDVVRSWVEDLEDDGLPAREALLMYKAELEKHGVAFPSFPEEWEDEVEEYK